MADSKAQTQQKEDQTVKQEEAPAKTEVPKGEIKHFEGTISKYDKDGNGPIASSTLEPGERLASEVDAEKAAKKAESAKK